MDEMVFLMPREVNGQEDENTRSCRGSGETALVAREGRTRN